jgi:hypothetical protein
VITSGCKYITSRPIACTCGALVLQSVAPLPLQLYCSKEKAGARLIPAHNKQIETKRHSINGANHTVRRSATKRASPGISLQNFLMQNFLID